MKVPLLIAVLIAGACGTICRWSIYLLLDKAVSTHFPATTLLINILGSFLAGLLFVLFKTRWSAYAEYAPVVLVGFLGAFTTFSTYALESARLLTGGGGLHAVVSILAQNLLGIGAACLGLFCGKQIA